MKIVILETHSQVAQYGANQIAKLIKFKPESVLGLATGSTPIRLYNNLVSKCRLGDISFEQIKTFNLDEYLGLDAEHPQSYRYFMNKNLFEHVDIDIRNTFVPVGTASDPVAECEAYETNLAKVGGIDLQLLGLGVCAAEAF